MAANSGLKALLTCLMKELASLQPSEVVGAMTPTAEAAVASFQVRLQSSLQMLCGLFGRCAKRHDRSR